jgi:hypothetical protein
MAMYRITAGLDLIGPGVPNEEPAVAALRHGESMVFYVSWKGDTETRVWRFYGVGKEGQRELLGEEKRVGFETGFYVGSSGGNQR